MSIVLTNVSHIYDSNSEMSVKALDNIDLTINDGDFIGLIGHTGSGKSTLIQHLNGLLKPTSGEIIVDGENICEKKYPLKTLRQKVGLVFQYPEHQLFEMTVLDDVCFGPKNLGLSSEECRERAKKALEMAGIAEELYGSSPFELSGGQKRRVAIAGVLAMEPKVLILDEPTAGLDPRGRDEILDSISKLHDEYGLTVILVSHSMEDVANYVSRILVMNKGKLIFDDIPSKVFMHIEELESVGLAAPQMTYIMNRLKSIGMDVNTDITTIGEATAEILRALKC
ncbi:MAG: energy-coupling factor transporter ATPase [Lachnospiraceae bacterium]|nr:energy-coupling factor transporter ATPase [Lachnospiraceae bacterium]